MQRMRGRRSAYRVGRSDSRVTRTAAGANLAGMLAILQAVIGTLRSPAPRAGSGASVLPPPAGTNDGTILDRVRLL